MIHPMSSSTDPQRSGHQVRIINKKNFFTVALIAFVSPFLHLLVRCRTASKNKRAEIEIWCPFLSTHTQDLHKGISHNFNTNLITAL